jgi:hypothetical protein
MYIHGIEVPSQVSENVPDNVDLPNSNGNGNEYNELLYSHLVISIKTPILFYL